MSALVGRRARPTHNQREEAVYRKELVYAEDGVDGRMRETLCALLRVRANYRSLLSLLVEK